MSQGNFVVILNILIFWQLCEYPGFFNDKYEVWPPIFWYSKSHPNSITNVCPSGIENEVPSRLQMVAVMSQMCLTIWHVFGSYLPYIWFILAFYLVQISTIYWAITTVVCLAPLDIMPRILPPCQTIFIHQRWKDNRKIKYLVWQNPVHKQY